MAVYQAIDSLLFSHIFKWTNILNMIFTTAGGIWWKSKQGGRVKEDGEGESQMRKEGSFRSIWNKEAQHKEGGRKVVSMKEDKYWVRRRRKWDGAVDAGPQPTGGKPLVDLSTICMLSGVNLHWFPAKWNALGFNRASALQEPPRCYIQPIGFRLTGSIWPHTEQLIFN